jgi:hypothetical protein
MPAFALFKLARVSCEGGGGIPVSVDILQSRLHRRRLSTVWTKADCSLVYSGGIEGIRCQDGHWDHPFASGVDAVREGARLDVDGDAGFLGSVFPEIFNETYTKMNRASTDNPLPSMENPTASSLLSPPKSGFLCPGIGGRVIFCQR